MDNPPPPATTGRTWFRLGSIARMEQPVPAPAPPPPQPQVPVGRSLIRPPPQPQPQNQPAPPPQPQPTRLPTLGGTFSVVQSPQATRPAATGVSSVPASPRAARPVTAAPSSSSVPQSPVRPPPTAGTSSMPQSPAKPQAGGSVSSLLQSPPRAKTTNGASSVPQSPAKPPAGGSKSPPSEKMANIVGTSSVPPSPRVIKEPSPVKSIKTINQSSSSPPRTANKNLGSPKTIKPATPPPSPLQLPPSQLKADPEPEPPVSRREPPPSPQQKDTLLPQVREQDRAVETKLHKQELTRHNARAHNRAWGGSEEESTGLTTITIAGDNRGAYMELLSSSSSPAALWKGKSESTGKGEEAKKKKNSNNDKADGGGMAEKPMAAFVNSNVQTVNNSILLNASCAHTSPGVHLALSRKPAARRPQDIHADDARHSHHA